MAMAVGEKNAVAMARGSGGAGCEQMEIGEGEREIKFFKF